MTYSLGIPSSAPADWQAVFAPSKVAGLGSTCQHFSIPSKAQPSSHGDARPTKINSFFFYFTYGSQKYFPRLHPPLELAIRIFFDFHEWNWSQVSSSERASFSSQNTTLTSLRIYNFRFYGLVPVKSCFFNISLRNGSITAHDISNWNLWPNKAFFDFASGGRGRLGVFVVIWGQNSKIFKPRQFVYQNEALGHLITKKVFSRSPDHKLGGD